MFCWVRIKPQCFPPHVRKLSADDTLMPHTDFKYRLITRRVPSVLYYFITTENKISRKIVQRYRKRVPGDESTSRSSYTHPHKQREGQVQFTPAWLIITVVVLLLLLFGCMSVPGLHLTAVTTKTIYQFSDGACTISACKY